MTESLEGKPHHIAAMIGTTTPRPIFLRGFRVGIDLFDRYPNRRIKTKRLAEVSPSMVL